MESFLEFVLKQLVESPDEVVVTKLEQGKKLVFKVEMRKSDVGRVIGRSGHTITAVRNLLSAAASRTGQQVLLQIVD
ncbi:MAG: KH domain-containing protein [Verrucomicrobia bacterium]|nr:KH domain-containing protein [Verrucomicrobiota bacterium]